MMHRRVRLTTSGVKPLRCGLAYTKKASRCKMLCALIGSGTKCRFVLSVNASPGRLPLPSGTFSVPRSGLADLPLKRSQCPLWRLLSVSRGLVT
nr:hypothetical protein [Arthrobacter sp.]